MCGIAGVLGPADTRVPAAELEALTREAAAVYAKPFRIEGKGRETRVVG